MISAVGSLSVAQLRFAGAAEATTIHGDLEILNLAGTLSPDGAHLHIAVADSRGAMIGGHLCTGSLVRTTAELVVCLLPEWHFWREMDPATGYPELRISPLAPPDQSLSSSSTIDTVLAPLNAPDFASFFSTGHAGYTNYSTLELQP